MVLALLLLLTACEAVPAAQSSTLADPVRAEDKGLAGLPGSPFPAPDRPVAGIVSSAWSDEASRDNEGEAAEVIRVLKIGPGQVVADIGAGSGYYTVRLSPVVGPDGKVYANDIIPDYLGRLKRRVVAEGLGNVEFILGDPGNSNLPPASTDVALLVHMYHEIADPFGLLWHLHDSLKPGGRVAIIDADRPTRRHGTPPDLLKCELAAVGFRQTERHRMSGGTYLAVFEAGTRPEPAAIEPCPARS